MRPCALVLVGLVALVLLPGRLVLAQSPEESNMTEMPIFGQPPVGDYLQPLGPTERARTAVQMLVVVVLSLVAVVFLLRWVTRGTKPEEQKTPEQKIVDKIEDVLRRADGEEGKANPKEPSRRS
ncbi:hypothetical protein LLH03_02195 [bacterium]|nr:hypothetical protein [bacterium]